MTTAELRAQRLAPGEAELPNGPALWRAQLGAMLWLELRRSMLSRRGLVLYLFAGIPIFIMTVIALVRVPGGQPVFENLEDARRGFAFVYQILILRMIVFFGCVTVFSNLIRGEILQRAFHYYLLSAIRRPLLVLGKYLAGLVQTSLLFVASLLLCYGLLYAPFGLERGLEDFFSGPGGVQLLAYIGITVLACVGYGAMFLAIGVLLKNPVLPAVILFFWELLHDLLPPALKQATVVHYLKGLAPVPVDLPLIAVVSDPPPALVSVVGLLIFASVGVAIAAFFVQRKEVDYGED